MKKDNTKLVKWLKDLKEKHTDKKEKDTIDDILYCFREFEETKKAMKEIRREQGSPRKIKRSFRNQE